MPATSEMYMQRCISLALLGAGRVAPNPMVGAVLVHQDRIIGEGYHRRYGESHAEVNCITSVAEADRHLIQQATLYVSLEPCAHFGKTPPCADLIITHRIPRVVIGCRDSYQEVNGKGIARLQAAGVEVTTGVLESECRNLNRRFFCVQEKKRPFVILKWAQSADHRIAGPGSDRLLISHSATNRLVHRWRSEEAAILAGSRTVLADDPALTTRLWAGPSPVRLVLDRHLLLPMDRKIFDGSVKTIVFNTLRQEEGGNPSYYRINEEELVIPQILQALYQLNIQSVLVEGGAKLLQAFIQEQLWDEARIITNQSLIVGEGLAAPLLPQVSITAQFKTGTDEVLICTPQHSR